MAHAQNIAQPMSRKIRKDTFDPSMTNFWGCIPIKREI